MPHAKIQLIPGLDTNETPALNQAAFTASQLVRFKSDRNGLGLIEKMGGWLQYSTALFSGVSQLLGWEDLSAAKRLAVGDQTGLYYLNSLTPNYKNNITPQQAPSNSPFLVPNAISAFVAGTTNTITTKAPTPSGMAIIFATSGTLPSGLTAGTIYYTVNSNYSAGSWTFQVSTSSTGTPIVSLVTTGSGSSTFTFQSVVATNGSSTVNVYDIGLGVASVTFASNKVTMGFDATGTTTAAVPQNGNSVVFYGSSLPSGITAGASYTVVPINSTTYSLTSGGSPVTFGTGSGIQFIPNQIQIGYSVNIQTPITAGGLLLSGVYQVSAFSSNSLYSTYQITASSSASSTAAGTLISFQTVSGSTTVTVTENPEPYVNGATATILWPTTGNGVTIYGNYIASGVTSTTYNINVSSPATATGNFKINTLSNGNSYVHFNYYYNQLSPYASSGYGTGGYGAGGYGVGVISNSGNPLGIPVNSNDWSLANFGEVLVASPDGGPIYYWSPTQNTSNAYLLSTAPIANYGIFVAMPARQLVAYGSTTTGIQDPLLVRWCDVGDLTVWTPTPTNQAGSYRIPEGSMIAAAIQGPQQTLLWTDLAVWAMQYVGPPAVYGFNKLADGAGAVSKKCVGLLNGSVYWWAPNKFMTTAGGGISPLQCQIADIVFQDVNLSATSLIRCATNSIFNEVVWFYPSNGSTINNKYVKYNVLTNTWDYGVLDRTSWIDQSVLGTPIGSSSGGVLYQHEQGYDAGNVSMVSSFQTGYAQLNEADSLVFIDQIWPDFRWATINGSTPPATLYMTFYGTNYPGDNPTIYGPYQITQQTEYLNVRIRNRLLSFGVSTSPDGTSANAAAGIFYRIGAVRYRYQLDGRF